jgi:chemotaxis family two-component system sensor kinase Cph1
MTTLDLCAQEPIHIPGAIQPHGALVCVADDRGPVLHRSANADAILAAPVTLGARLPLGLESPGSQRRDGRWLQVSAHRTAQGLLLEFEPLTGADDPSPDEAFNTLHRFIDRAGPMADLRDVGQAAVEQVRAMTGFNRVLLYRFDTDWNGTVIAEDGDCVLPSYLDLRFPASDIPAQVRALYLRNRVRLIPDATCQPVPLDPPISPIDGQPLDLTPISLRSVSPVHLQYMRNMETAASMSIALIADGRLWGLISCHHRVAHWVSPRVRLACEFLGQLVGRQIVARERVVEAGRRIALKRIETELLVHLARTDGFQAGLAANPDAWLAVTNAAGAAVVSDGQAYLAGQTPTAEQVGDIAAWLRAGPNQSVYATDSLTAAWPAAAGFAARASGLLAVSISQLYPSYVMWFRPERVQTVTWAGDPRKSSDPATLSPRSSFEQWKQLVRHTAAPWRSEEIATATDLRHAIIDFVLRHAEERAEMTARLQHSNRELEAFSYSVSHDLRAPFRHIVGYAELLRDREPDLDATSRRFLDTIRDAALSAGHLVDDLLAFSQLNRAPLTAGPIDMNKLAREARAAAMLGCGDRRIDWRIGELPPTWGDVTMMRQVMLNLLSNAVKYTGRRARAEIIVEGVENDTETVYIVRDNGIGFDMRYVGKLFGVFQRLHRVEDFEGTGVGLALTKRVIDRHHGWIKAEGVEDQGAIFTFALPHGAMENQRA